MVKWLPGSSCRHKPTYCHMQSALREEVCTQGEGKKGSMIPILKIDSNILRVANFSRFVNRIISDYFLHGSYLSKNLPPPTHSFLNPINTIFGISLSFQQFSWQDSEQENIKIPHTETPTKYTGVGVILKQTSFVQAETAQVYS